MLGPGKINYLSILLISLKLRQLLHLLDLINKTGAKYIFQLRYIDILSNNKIQILSIIQ